MVHKHRPHNLPGHTDLIGEEGVSKTDARIRALGAVDEASAALGLAKSLIHNTGHKQLLATCQADLSMIMAVLAGWGKADKAAETTSSTISQVLAGLENAISGLEEQIVLPTQFILSGNTPGSGALALARTIVRRAEREVVGLAQSQASIDVDILQYLNRLSTLCFLLEVAETGAQSST
ncbi:MAG: ATP:cob(I)alamin adenosyltransferase [Anaerolineaceae bacterium]